MCRRQLFSAFFANAKDYHVQNIIQSQHMNVKGTYFSEHNFLQKCTGILE